LALIPGLGSQNRWSKSLALRAFLERGVLVKKQDRKPYRL
jgi:hypothetical protein